MKKFLLFGICVLITGCWAYAFDNESGTELNIRPKADIVEEIDINIPVAEPAEVQEVLPVENIFEQTVEKPEDIKEIIQPESERILPENIDVKLPEEDLKSIEEIQAVEEEIVSEENAEEQFKEDDFESSEDDIELEIPVRDKIKIVEPDQKKQTETIMDSVDRKNYTIMPYGNSSGTIYRF